jgi:hypothetical protein
MTFKEFGMLSIRWKIFSLVALGCVGINAVMAQAVNLQAGEWEYTNELVFGGGLTPQKQIFTDCVTEDEIKEGALLGLTIDGCEIHEQRISTNNMHYVMTCEGPEGTRLSVDANIEFDGDTAQGVIKNLVATPLGDMEMTVNMTARRLGDCDEDSDS